MKRFLIWAGAKIGQFFWSWRFLRAVLAIVLLVVLFYTEEDWRGAHRWAANKAKWEAKGETFDLAKFTPPPIPDDQNLAAIPLFKLEPLSKTDSFSGPVALQKAMRQDLPGNDLPSFGYGVSGYGPDLAKIRNVIAKDYAEAFPGAKPPDGTLEQFNALYPFLKDFLAASEVRPLCRLPADYTSSPPAVRPLGAIVAGIKLSKILTLQALLALDQHQPDLALQDIKANYTMLIGTKRDPTVIGGLVGIGMTVISDTALSDGLARHAWSDAQLAEIEQMLKPIHFLADYQFAMRCEAAESTANFDCSSKRNPYGSLFDIYRRVVDPDEATWMRFAPPWPQGWWEENKSQATDFYFREMSTVDPRAGRAFPEIDRALKEQFMRAKARWEAMAPSNIIFYIAASPLSSLTVKYALAQVRIDEARIAVALERYRLAHGAYPGSLDALAPTFIDAVPHDVVTGEEYRYRVQADGTYVLYSVGWNQKDDGGTVAYEKDVPKDLPPRQDFEQGDWPWIMPR